MSHPELLRLQAYFDAEVDACAAAEIERHIEHCADCRALLQDFEHTRTAIRRDAAYFLAPTQLRMRIQQTLDRESESGAPRVVAKHATTRRTRSFWVGAFSGLASAAAVVALTLFVLRPSWTSPVLDDLVAAHVRSLMPTHLIDVASTDRHTVKPWFAGHADVSPVVADFPQQGYALIGGRADYLNHQRAAVTVYQHGRHIINVFSWAADQQRLPRDTMRDGYRLIFWRSEDLAYCAVSDTGQDELLGLARLLQDLGAHDGRQ